MTYDPTIVDLLAHQVLNCVCAALDRTAEQVDGQPGCPCRTGVVPGQPALVLCGTDCKDQPDQHGQLYVHIERTFRTRSFPAPDTGVIDCAATTFAVELVITLMRCMPSWTSGTPPTIDKLQAAATIEHTDMLTVLQAVQCCVPDDPLRRKKRRVALIEQRRKGPDGLNVGFETRIVADLNSPCGCPPEDS